MKKLAALSLALISGFAGASGITIQTGSAFEAGLANAYAYRTDVTAVVGAPTSISSYDSLSVPLGNYAFESTITFDVTSSTTYDFRAGVDFGGGGAMFLDGVAIAFNNNDMWWNYGYTDATQFLANATGIDLSVGVHTLNLYGFEGCCSGNSQVQFSVDGGQNYTSFSNTDGLPAIPEAQNFAMLLAGLGLIGTLARRRANKQA